MPAILGHTWALAGIEVLPLKAQLVGRRHRGEILPDSDLL